MAIIDCPEGMRITDMRPPTSGGREWTTEELRRLVRLKQNGFEWLHIAEEFGCTAAQAQHRYISLKNEIDKNLAK